MASIIKLYNFFLLGAVGSQKGILESLRLQFWDTVMMKLWIYKVLKIGALKIDHH